jgi:hypothetical protein
MNLRIGLIQTTTGIDPLVEAEGLALRIAEAAAQGAQIIFTPEMSGLLDRDRSRAAGHVRTEANDIVLAAVRAAAAQHRVWVQLGSLALRSETSDKFVNRGFLIDPTGTVVYTVFKETDFATSLRDGPYAQSNLGALARRVLDGAATAGATACDFAAYAPSYGAPAGFIAAPIVVDGKVAGAIAVNHGPEFSYVWDSTECRLLYAWRGGFLLCALEVALKNELRSAMRTMQQLGLLVDLFGVDWSHLWLQSQDGSVVLTPDLKLSHFTDRHLLSNVASLEDLNAKMRGMERATWEGMGLIRTRMDVDAALSALEGVAVDVPVSRVPSATGPSRQDVNRVLHAYPAAAASGCNRMLHAYPVAVEQPQADEPPAPEQQLKRRATASPARTCARH